MKIWGAAACLVAALSLLAAPAAEAKPGYSVVPGGFVLQARLPKSNGYSVSLLATHRWVELVASRGRESAAYIAPGHATAAGVEADFGRFGRVEAEWSGSVKPLAEDSHRCRGKSTLEGHGVLRGTIRLRGEKGFVSVLAAHAKSSFDRSFRQVCRKGGGVHGTTVNGLGIGHGLLSRATSPPVQAEEEAIFSGDVLEARTREGGRGVYFTAIRLDVDDLLEFTALTTERVGNVLVAKLAQSPSGSLAFSEPDIATVAPGPPFRGTASFRAASGGVAEWSGSLQVSLPGLATQPLAGAGFQAIACHPQDPVLFEGCAKSAQRPSLRPQGSGSHSQPLAEAKLSWSR